MGSGNPKIYESVILIASNLLAKIEKKGLVGEYGFEDVMTMAVVSLVKNDCFAYEDLADYDPVMDAGVPEEEIIADRYIFTRLATDRKYRAFAEKMYKELVRG